MFSLADLKTDGGLSPGPKDLNRNENSVTHDDANLIEHFKSDHASLLAILHHVEDELMRGHFSAIPSQLRAFREHLQSHLAEESEKFYAPLHVHPLGDAAVMQMVKQAETRMQGIARLVLVFTKSYIESGITQQNREQFARDLETIESLLADRIQTEETSLYPLCSPD